VKERSLRSHGGTDLTGSFHLMEEKDARDFIFSRAQKGFTNTRYIQEVLINVCETIGYCNANNIPGCIVAIDQAKAFDTISNRYMVEVYKFFGFGENMIRLLSVLGSNRTATISFDDGTFSPEFDLERGRTQGNGPSPCEYNFGQQILLFNPGKNGPLGAPM
jgi:hypothetical protein